MKELLIDVVYSLLVTVAIQVLLHLCSGIEYHVFTADLDCDSILRLILLLEELARYCVVAEELSLHVVFQ